MLCNHHVIQHGQRFKEADILEGSRDAGVRDAVRTHAGDIAPQKGDAALGRGIDAGNHVEGSRLARAVRTDKRDDFLTVDVHG